MRNSQDFFKRYQHYCANAVAKELFPEFRSLKAWHFRYVLGSWHSDDDLAWHCPQLCHTLVSSTSFGICFGIARSRANVSKEYKKPDVIGQSARMVKYKPHNERVPGRFMKIQKIARRNLRQTLCSHKTSLRMDRHRDGPW